MLTRLPRDHVSRSRSRTGARRAQGLGPLPCGRCQPDAADDTIAAETPGEAYVVVGIGYLVKIVGEIAGPTVKLDSTDGTTPIPITNPADPGLLVLQVSIR